MRTAVISLIALSGLATAAGAQQPAATPPATPAPAAAAPAPTTATQAPAAAAPAPATPSTPATPEGAPAASAAAPAGSLQSAPQPAAAANPTLPTSGDGAVVLQLLQQVCIPIVKGGSFDQIAKANGMKKARGGNYVGALGADRNYSVTLQAQGSNKNVCQLDIRYAVGQEASIVNALNIYAFLHNPELKLQRNDFVVGEDNVKRVTLSWEYYTDKVSTGLVFVQLKNPDGSPLNARFDSATLLYSERTF